VSSRYGVIIVGAGFAGLGMAAALRRAGREDFVVLEKAAELGGTWRDNTYPGCACDIPSHLYSFSFARNPDWTRAYSAQPEILAYLRRVADERDLRRHIRFGAEVTAARFDGGSWQVSTADGAGYNGRALVLAMGPLHRPAYPDLPGRFEGVAFHSARWDHGYDLRGRRVAVIGTGASAIQFVPQIAPLVDRLYVFQRTAPWLLPRPDRAFGERRKALFRRLPAAHWAYRATVYWRLEAAALGFTVNPKMMGLAAKLARQQLHHQVTDPDLRRRLTPDYTIGCKRILISSDYYPALAAPNVELVTDRIARVGAEKIVTADGTARPVDAIIFGTGFQVTDGIGDVAVTGPDGRRLADAWTPGMVGYLGTVVAGFPNLFTLLGPNTGLGHNSVVFMAEAQIRYVLRCLRLLAGHRRVEVSGPAQQRFNRRLQARMNRTVWTVGGCRSWYLDADGVNRALWPGSSAGFWLRTRRLRRRDLVVGD
jgi:cation diffusion facilitator CzcD-associated flavoprotein CzcO